MTMAQDASRTRDNLAALRQETLTLVQLFGGCVALVLIVWLLRPGVSTPIPAAAWASTGAIVLGVAMSYALTGHHQRTAAFTIVGAILCGTACGASALGSPNGFYLLAIPVIFSSALVSQLALVAVGGIAIVLISAIGHGNMGLAPLSGPLLGPIAIVMLGTFACSLSTRNLHRSLHWVWDGYDTALTNARIAREESAKLQRVLLAFEDSTRRLELANQALRMARREAEDARRFEQRFAQTISHELRTPLNIIMGFTDLMVQSPADYGDRLPPAFARDLAIVHRNARHLQALINDVLDLGRIEAAQMGLAVEEVDPKALVEEAVALVRSVAAERRLGLRVEMAPDLPRLSLDPIRIRQVLINLLNNAARFTERGEITIRVARQDERLLFSVADTGEGIPPEHMPHLFEAFHQVDTGTRRRHDGAGLGLTISKQFVELHGGRMWAESDVGRGSTFYFSLPLIRDRAGTAPLSGAVGPGPASDSSGGDEGVLIAITRSSRTKALLDRHMHGYRTVVVEDPDQGQQLAHDLLPQAVVVDTGSAGFELLEAERLACAWGLPDVPFITCDLPGEETLRRALDVTGYLIKPISRDALMHLLSQFGDRIRTVLVVDDDRDFVRLVGRMLHSDAHSYDVVGAHTGQEALAVMSLRCPDMVLLDLGLPDMDGCQLLEQMRTSPDWRDIPIIVISIRDEADRSGVLSRHMLVTKGSGILPGELLGWVQGVLDASRDSTVQAGV